MNPAPAHVPPLRAAVIGLGGNIEPRLDHLRGAVHALAHVESLRVAAVSPVYETEPWGVTNQPDFLNAAVRIETALPPLALLDVLLDIEKRLGRDRSRDAPHWGPRIIDLDILFIAGEVFEDRRLAIPHRRLLERDFALRPLLDVLPGAIDPRDGVALARRLEQLGTPPLKVFAPPIQIAPPAPQAA